MAFLDETRQLIPKLFQDLSFRPHFWGTGFGVRGLGFGFELEGLGLRRVAGHAVAQLAGPRDSG